MSDDHTRDGFLYFISAPQGKNEWYRKFVDSTKKESPEFFGVDWALGSGMNRGEIINRKGNVIYVRFKTVSICTTQD